MQALKICFPYVWELFEKASGIFANQGSIKK